MSAAIVIGQLSKLVQDLETWTPGLNDVLCTEDELNVLDVLGTKLANTLAIIQKKAGSFKLSRDEKAWTASAKLRSQAQSAIVSLINDGKLERLVVFRRNIVLIFTGPKDSDFDSDDMKTRKATTRQRCETIRQLNADGIVAWAASYAPTSWAAGCMGNDIFECLVNNIEPRSAQSWPAVIQQTVEKLRTNEVLGNSVEYGEFMNAIKDPSRQTRPRSGKRRRFSYDGQTRICKLTEPPSEAQMGKTPMWNARPSGSSQSLYEQSFDNGSLDFMPILYLPLEFYKYSGLLTSQLETICGSYLSNAIKTSYLWDGGTATHCFGVAFPSNPFQDAIVVMSISQLAGTQLIQFIDSMPPTPSLLGRHIQQEH